MRHRDSGALERCGRSSASAAVPPKPSPIAVPVRSTVVTTGTGPWGVLGRELGSASLGQAGTQVDDPLPRTSGRRCRSVSGGALQCLGGRIEFVGVQVRLGQERAV